MATRADGITVTTQRHGPVMVLMLEHPPVNALSAPIRIGLLSALKQSQADNSIGAIVLAGAGRAFSAGADIREFGGNQVGPDLPEVCLTIESSGKLVVAAMHGFALGGALELALAAHYRLAEEGTQLGLPEVRLGLMPGAGGTQRLPRLVGIGAASRLMLSGRSIDAGEALSIGLIDIKVAAIDAGAAGRAYAAKLLTEAAPVRRTRDARGTADPVAESARLTELAEEFHRKPATLFAHLKILEALRAAIELPFEAGLTLEREFFRQCVESTQRQALTHVFFAEREVSKVPALTNVIPRPISHVGVVGGGTMGAGIAVAVLDAGLSVTLIERDPTALHRGRLQVEKVYDSRITKGSLTPQSKALILSHFRGTEAFEGLAQADLVIEAVYEEMAVKQEVFAQLDRVCKPGAVLATNTSYLDVAKIAAATSRPRDVIGLHFFSPAYVMKLLEIVVPIGARSEVIATAFKFAKTLNKVAVRAEVCDGFIANRIMTVCRTAAEYLMEDGASPYAIDEALRDFGFAMGPFQVSDLAGGDIGWATRKRKAPTRDPTARYVQVGDRLCERGWFGQKTGRGYYRYVDGARTGVPDPEVLAILELERKRAGVRPQEFPLKQIVRRYLAAMINESASVVQQGIALRPLDIDVALIHGYGFPRHLGGPMHYADRVGLPRIRADIEEFAAHDPRFWQLSPLLADLTSRSADFSSLNRLE